VKEKPARKDHFGPFSYFYLIILLSTLAKFASGKSLKDLIKIWSKIVQ